MSRDYGKVATAFWKSPAIRSLSDQGKLLANYLITSPHSNMLGSYLLPDAYIADDLEWKPETVRKALSELFENGFAKRFMDGRHIVICKFLEWNPIENPNVGKAALKLFDQLPADHNLSYVINGLKQYAKQFPDGFESLEERLPKPFRNQEQEPEPSPEPEPEPKPEQELARSAHADEFLAIQAYNTVAEELNWPIAQRSTAKRRSALKRRLAECGGIEGWLAAMAKARASPFLRGDSGRDRAHAGWCPDLDFFLQESSFAKLMEGKYDQRGFTGNASGFDAIREGARGAAGLDRTGRPIVVDEPGDELGRLALSGTR